MSDCLSFLKEIGESFTKYTSKMGGGWLGGLGRSENLKNSSGNG